MFCVHYYVESAKTMTQETLRKYINGDASDEERLEVLHWAEESEDNRKELMAYRSLCNALIFNGKSDKKASRNELGRKRRAVIFRRAVEIIGVAAAIAVGVFFGFRHLETDTPIAVETLSAPAGLITESILSDGTKICLNAGSKLEIINYKKNERRVRLCGEAYFDVTRDEMRPFIVETGKIAVRVLGTEFDVNSKGDEHSVVLVRGAVQVDSQTDEETLSYRLVPGQRLKKPVRRFGKYRPCQHRGLHLVDKRLPKIRETSSGTGHPKDSGLLRHLHPPRWTAEGCLSNHRQA